MCVHDDSCRRHNPRSAYNVTSYPQYKSDQQKALIVFSMCVVSVYPYISWSWQKMTFNIANKQTRTATSDTAENDTSNNSEKGKRHLEWKRHLEHLEKSMSQWIGKISLISPLCSWEQIVKLKIIEWCKIALCYLLISRTLPSSTAIGLRSIEIMTNRVVFWKHVCCLTWGFLFATALAWERMFVFVFYGGAIDLNAIC